MIDLRLRTVISDEELDHKVGKIVTAGDYNALFTGPARIRRPDGPVLAVFLPGVLKPAMAAAYDVLTTIRITTSNRGLASGTDRRQRGEQKRSYARSIESAIIGSIDAKSAASKVAARMMACRLTAWTGTHLPEWESLRPLLAQIGDHLREEVPERYAAQAKAAAETHPDWLIPGTPFTTVTVNNTYSTGVHQDAGDLEEGFSTLAVCRRREWAEKRDAKSDAAAEKAHQMFDAIPFGQPILGDHYSAGRDRRYRDRAAATMDRAVEDGRKATEMRSKAANIEAAAEAAIYSDDSDAVEQLRERIATLEAERDRVKAYNASCRRGARDLSLLDERQRALILRIAESTPYALKKDGAFPGYHLSNLSGNIKRNRDRLAELQSAG